MSGEILPGSGADLVNYRCYLLLYFVVILEFMHYSDHDTLRADLWVKRLCSILMLLQLAFKLIFVILILLSTATFARLLVYFAHLNWRQRAI